MRHRKHNYVVGFSGEENCVYGSDDANEKYCFINPMTRLEAEKQAKTLENSLPAKRYVFKLVPVMSID